MGLTFFESMSGELIDESGVTRHVAFDLRCDTTHVSRLLIDGQLRASGTVRALPWADGAACAGTVSMQPLTRRRIEYDLRFRGGDDAEWRLVARKRVRAWQLLDSMTRAEASLERAGVTVARGVLEFHLDDMPAFLRSWRPRVDGRRSADAAATDDDVVLSRAERATLAALAETIITPKGAVPAVDSRTVSAAEHVLRYMPGPGLLGYRAGLRTLDGVARARYARAFAALDVRRRRTVLDVMTRANPVGGDSTRLALGLPVKMAHFSRRDYLDAVGLPDYAATSDGPPPRWAANVSAPEDLPRDTVAECDVVVVGTGAGGAAAAASLAERGLTVVLVEEGRYERRPQFAGGPEERMLKFWRDGGMNLAVGNAGGVGVPVGRMVGGTTAINSGTCFRTPDDVLEDWRGGLGFPADFRAERFAAWLDRVERELQVRPADRRYLGRIADIVAKGTEEMGGTHGPLNRNAPDCDGQGLCVVGCPTLAKRSADVTWVPRALTAGAHLFTGLPVRRILLDGRRAVGVVAEGQDRFGAPRRVEVRARAVVLAAGSLHTPLLLRSNGIDLPWIGRNLSIHPALGAMALMPDEDRKPWQAIPQGYFAEGIGDDRIRFEGGYAPPSIGAAAMPFDGPELSRWMNAWSRVEQFGFMTRDEGVGSVVAGPLGRPFIRYSITPRVLESFRRGSAALAEMLLRGGAVEVATRIQGVGTVSTVDQARAILERRPAPRHFVAMGFHPLGTARMGRSPDHAVVDFDHRVFGTRGLYVADGSCVPTSLGVNPQMTIMAMGLRAAAIIADDLDAHDQLDATLGHAAHTDGRGRVLVSG